jgi:hypothetical protein
MGKNPVLVVLLVGAASPLAAQGREDSWDNLRQLRLGETIEVVDAKMRSHHGAFAAYTEDAISLRQGGGELSLPRAEVASVKRRRESPRGRNALLGLAIGAAGGLAVGAIRGQTYHEAGETPVFIAVWTPIGAGVGAIVGAAAPTRGEVTVYRATSLRR